MSKIFLSHSSQDNFEAVALRDWLSREGWDDVFLDLDPDRGIAPGERWERALHEAALRCEAIVFLISANWFASGWCMKEYTLARTLNKKLFAVIVDATKSLKDLPPELKDTWQAVDLAGGQDGELRPTTLPGSHEERHVVFSRDGLRRLKRGLEAAGLDPKFFAWPPEGDPNRTPYRGLKSLEQQDAGIFFGREAPIVETTDRLRGLRLSAAPRLLVLLGASGAGKSSFLRAGLLPRLARDDRNFLPLPVIRPERAALTGENGLLQALETALPTRSRASLRKAMEAGATALRPMLQELAVSARASGESNAPTIVLAVDQAEELFRPEGRTEGEALLTLIRDLASVDLPPILAIFAIRSDSYDSLEHAKALEGLPQSTQALLPMPRGAYKEVIEGPARRFAQSGGALTIEPQLTQRLMEDIERGGGSDALPLLAFTLEQLFLDYRSTGQLLLQNYEDFGGLKGAINSAVERAFMRADADPRIPSDRKARETLLRRGLIPWLAGIDPDSKSPRRNIARRADIPAEAAPLIDLLVEERLLATDTVSSRDSATGVESRVVTIEPAHEALLRQWGLLQGWLNEDFGLLATLEGVKRAARDWDASDRSAAWLAHQEQRLADAQALDTRADISAKLDATDRNYLAGCRAREDAQRAEVEARRREREDEHARQLDDARKLAAAEHKSARRTRYALFGVLSAVVFGVLAAAGVYYENERRALEERQRVSAETLQREAQRQAQTAELRRRIQLLLGASQQRASEFDFGTSGLLALEALKLVQRDDAAAQYSSAVASLYEAVRGNRELMDLLGHTQSVEFASFSPDGGLALTASGDELWVWDPVAGTVVKKIELAGGPAHSFIRAAWMSPDRAQIMTIDAADARLFDFKTGAQISSFDAHLAWFNPTGTRLVLAGHDGIQIVDPQTKAVLFKLEGDPESLLSGGFSADGARFATSDETKAIRIWNVADGRLLSRFVADAPADCLALNSDGTKLATSVRERGFQVRDAANGDLLGDTVSQRLKFANQCSSLSFSPDSRRLLVVSADVTADIWNYESGETVRLRGHKDAITSGAFSPDGQVVATASKDNTLRLWDAAGGDVVAILGGHHGKVTGVSFSADGSRVISASDDDTARIWKTGYPLDEKKIADAGKDTRTAALSPNGKQLAVLSDNGVVTMLSTQDEGSSWRIEGDWTSLAFDPSGNRLALGASDGSVSLVDLTTRAISAPWKAGDDPIESVAFAPDGKHLASGSDTGELHLWAEGGSGWTSVASIERGVGITVTSFDSKGSRLLSGAIDGSLSVIDAESQKQVFFSAPDGNTVRAAAFSPDGLSLVSCSDGPFAKIWDIATQKQVAFLGHESSVRALAFDATGKKLVTVTTGGAIREWRNENFSNSSIPELVQRTRFPKIVFGGVDEANSRYLLATSDGIVAVWPRWKEMDDLLKYSAAHVPRALLKWERAAYSID